MDDAGCSRCDARGDGGSVTPVIWGRQRRVTVLARWEYGQEREWGRGHRGVLYGWVEGTKTKVCHLGQQKRGRARRTRAWIQFASRARSRRRPMRDPENMYIDGPRWSQAQYVPPSGTPGPLGIGQRTPPSSQKSVTVASQRVHCTCRQWSHARPGLWRKRARQLPAASCQQRRVTGKSYFFAAAVPPLCCKLSTLDALCMHA